MASNADDVPQRFLDCLVARDRDGLIDLMAPRVRLRGMAPGRSWDGQDAVTAVDEILLGDFFGPDVEITALTWSRISGVGDTNSASYRLLMRKGQEDLQCEQHTFFDIDGGRIHSLHLMCSGFLPA